MRDVERRLAALEGRLVRQGRRWDFTNLTDEDLDFSESFRNVKSMPELPAADVERLERILLSAGQIQGTA